MKNYLNMTSPIGMIQIKALQGAIVAIDFLDEDSHLGPGPCDQSCLQVLLSAQSQLNQYFSRERITFNLPLLLNGTDFQIKVWKSLMKIEYGQVATYKDIAILANCPKGYRAVGNANGKNPIPIIIPCHRIISSDGGLGGFSAGIDRKIGLLAIEGVVFPK